MTVVQEDPMTEPNPPIQVVVAYDFSPSAEQALARAIEVAARAPQHVLHIIAAVDPHAPAAGGGLLKRVSYEAVAELQRLITDNVAKAFTGRETACEVKFNVHARIGKAVTEILALADEVGADLIFIGSHGKVGVERLLLGSVSERIVREAKCPVMVVRPKTYEEVELLHVTPYEHERPKHHEPHSYTYSNGAGLVRSNNWPYGGGPG